MMLRAKNIPGRNIYTQWALDTPQWRIEEAWTKTRHLIKRVDAPWISDYKRLEGHPPTGTMPDSPEQLEFTLRVSGADRTADVESEPNRNYTELMVEFMGVSFPPNFEDMLVNVESRIPEGGAPTGTAYILEFTTKDWVKLELDGMSGNTTHPFYTSEHVSRVAWYVPKPDPGFTYIDPEVPGHVILKFVHTNTRPFVSKYDLVQLVAVETRNGGLDPGFAMQSDANYDGSSDLTDVDLFMSNWASGSPAADANVDNVVDAVDLDDFFAHYVIE